MESVFILLQGKNHSGDVGEKGKGNQVAFIMDS